MDRLTNCYYVDLVFNYLPSHVVAFGRVITGNDCADNQAKIGAQLARVMQRDYPDFNSWDGICYGVAKTQIKKAVDRSMQKIWNQYLEVSELAGELAHEIKNPLTPIQLATERLSRRYRKQITDNPELFEDLTATIIRQVGDLRRMVDEFSSFARLPKPVFRAEDPVALTRQALFLQEVARPDVDFTFAAGDEIGTIDCDRHQFGQAMTNVLKNAVEATETKARDAGEDYKGRIAVDITASEDCIQVRIADNGIGLSQARERIIEPYVTTREKGTGLGLAIVNKIVEEHGGDMTFTPAEGGGTVVTMRFAADPLLRQRKQEAAE